MTRPNDGASVRPPELAPTRRRRRRRGGQQRAAVPAVTRPLGISPTPSAAGPGLDAIADYQALAHIADLSAQLTAIHPAFVPVAVIAEELLLGRGELLHRLGMTPLVPEVSNRVQILDKVYRLPDRTDAVVQEIRSTLAAIAVTSTQQESPMHNLSSTPTIDPNPSLNGITPPKSLGFLQRTIITVRQTLPTLPTLPTLRWPSRTETLIGAGLVVVAAGVYLAVTAEIPTADA